ncbi:hypothetical protein PLICRDRAFT_35702 [Plicaturopsis crispa FD-325 SS-3]|nr:hypothetical protein PLICRDRAFT_35702 [Plicaturopsis crispa FD-325 SS-3]
MALTESDASKQTPSPAVDGPASAVEDIALQDDAPSSSRNPSSDTPKTENSSRPLYIYTRAQALYLHKSPLVKPPEGMPALKDWFGSDNEQNINKKELEVPNPTSARDRRFRRDPEDGETPPRPSFRGSLSQPSQMGNFKHQSLRSGDRDRDRDVDKDRERDKDSRDTRDTLRTLSDKWDRDRLGHPTAPLYRNKERDSAPHLPPGSSSRLNAQRDTAAASSRRPETRDPAGKKKIGETTEDWRRGAEPPRTARDELNGRRDRDRDERERPRSRVRDSSRPRRESSRPRRETSRIRRDRERDLDRDDRDRDRDRRGGRDRDDALRDADRAYDRDKDYARRDKDADKDYDLDDPRRWRDDGKRDDRVSARRDRDYRDRVRDRAPHDGELSHEKHGDRRWTVVEDRDGRSKRSSGRDRRSGGAIAEEGRDDRRDREREKEKEPAWMDTYIPSTSSGGILGGKGEEGELDGIQAWKKGMKEKEQKDKGGAGDPLDKTPKAGGAPTSGGQDKQLDEIQLFKLMMKREQDQKKPADGTLGEPTLAASPNENGIHRQPSKASLGVQEKSQPRAVDDALSRQASTSQSSLPDTAPPPPASGPPQTLLSILASGSHDPGATPLTITHHNPPPPNDPSLDASATTGSRFFPKPLPNQAPAASQAPDRNAFEVSSVRSPAPTQFNPPPGSRLLAFRTSSAASASGISSSKPQSPANPLNGQGTSFQHPPGLPGSHSHNVLQGGISLSHSPDIPFNSRASMPDNLRVQQQGFSPFDEASRTAFGHEQLRDPSNFANGSDQLRRASAAAASDRSPFSTPIDPGYNDLNNGKGSRFAKFFDGKAREGPQPAARKPSGFVSPPTAGHRQDSGAFDAMMGGNPDNRAMNDIFAMLSNSSQHEQQRINPGVQLGLGQQLGNAPYGQGLNNLQSLQQQQIPSNSRLDSLYESRMEDRHFVPDGMVPGLRSVPPPRRESANMFSDSMDEPMQFNPQRGLPPQRGNVDQMFSGHVPSMYNQQGGRNVGIPVQPSQFRGGPSPINVQHSLQGPGQQRLPPGLANLGGRPPHEPSQFMGGAPIGLGAGGLHGPIHGNGPSPQQFNNFGGGGGGAGLGFGGGPQMRGAPPPAPHHLQNPLLHGGSIGGMGGSGNLDLRGPNLTQAQLNQAQLLAMNGGGMRGGGGFGQQQGHNPQMQPPLGLRQHQQHQQQQQQQHTPPHMLPHMLPPHLQQQGLPAPNNQPAHDLMALLMGGHRE